VAVRYEDVVADPQAFLQTLAAALGVAMNEQFTPVTTHRARNHIPYVPRDYPPIAEDDLAFIRSELDETQERAAGYRL
jgi:hypothetical protein